MSGIPEELRTIEEWEAARDSDRERIEDDERLAIPSCIPGWVVWMVDGHVGWLAVDVAKRLCEDMRGAARLAMLPNETE